MSATGKKGVKRKLDVKTIEFKYLALLEVESGRKTKSEIARDLEISTSTLSTWIKNADSIKEGYATLGPKRKTMKVGKWEELETALIRWFTNARDNGAVISGAILLQKADEFANKLGITDFHAKQGWLSRFKERHGICFKSICGEIKSVNEDSIAIKQWNSKLHELMSRYHPDDIYNADETGIFYKLLPDKTLEFKNVKCQGGKRSKERITALVCANMSGTNKLPLLIIGKCAKPRCFKNIKTLPTKYSFNKKAWMTSVIFTSWLHEFDRQMIRKDRKAVMIVDNCPAHPKCDGLKNTELVFLPPNTTCKTQPMDQGVINNLKVHYRRRVILRQIKSIDTKTEFSLTLLNAMVMLRESWDSVSSKTIFNCYKHAGFVTNTLQSINNNGDDDDDDEDELDNVPIAKLAVVGDKLVLNKFIEFDEDIETTSSITDDDIVDDILTSKEDVEDDEEDDVEEVNVNPPNHEETLEALNVARRYF